MFYFYIMFFRKDFRFMWKPKAEWLNLEKCLHHYSEMCLRNLNFGIKPSDTKDLSVSIICLILNNSQFFNF